MSTTKDSADAVRAAEERWREETLEPALKKVPERAEKFTTVSLYPIERLYTPSDLEGIDFQNDVGFPGEYPYTRGIHATGHRGRLWTMRQFAGFGTPEETNARYKALLQAGGTGLSVAFDLPTLMGRDPDHELSLGAQELAEAFGTEATFPLLSANVRPRTGAPLERVLLPSTLLNIAGLQVGVVGVANASSPPNLGSADNPWQLDVAAEQARAVQSAVDALASRAALIVGRASCPR